jgi:hypothetical protein
MRTTVYQNQCSTALKPQAQYKFNIHKKHHYKLNKAILLHNLTTLAEILFVPILFGVFYILMLFLA